MRKTSMARGLRRFSLLLALCWINYAGASPSLTTSTITPLFARSGVSFNSTSIACDNFSIQCLDDAEEIYDKVLGDEESCTADSDFSEDCSNRCNAVYLDLLHECLDRCPNFSITSHPVFGKCPEQFESMMQESSRISTPAPSNSTLTEAVNAKLESTDEEHEENEKPDIMKIVIGCVVGLVLVPAAVASLFFWRRYRAQRKVSGVMDDPHVTPFGGLGGFGSRGQYSQIDDDKSVRSLLFSADPAESEHDSLLQQTHDSFDSSRQIDVEKTPVPISNHPLPPPSVERKPFHPPSHSASLPISAPAPLSGSARSSMTLISTDPPSPFPSQTTFGIAAAAAGQSGRPTHRPSLSGQSTPKHRRELSLPHIVNSRTPPVPLAAAAAGAVSGATDKTHTRRISIQRQVADLQTRAGPSPPPGRTGLRPLMAGTPLSQDARWTRTRRDTGESSTSTSRAADGPPPLEPPAGAQEQYARLGGGFTFPPPASAPSPPPPPAQTGAGA